MLERFLDQIGEVLRLCEDTDGILVVNPIQISFYFIFH